MKKKQIQFALMVVLAVLLPASSPGAIELARNGTAGDGFARCNSIVRPHAALLKRSVPCLWPEGNANGARARDFHSCSPLCVLAGVDPRDLKAHPGIALIGKDRRIHRNSWRYSFVSSQMADVALPSAYPSFDGWAAEGIEADECRQELEARAYLGRFDRRSLPQIDQENHQGPIAPGESGKSSRGYTRKVASRSTPQRGGFEFEPSRSLPSAVLETVRHAFPLVDGERHAVLGERVFGELPSAHRQATQSAQRILSAARVLDIDGPEIHVPDLAHLLSLQNFAFVAGRRGQFFPWRSLDRQPGINGRTGFHIVFDQAGFGLDAPKQDPFADVQGESCLLCLNPFVSEARGRGVKKNYVDRSASNEKSQSGQNSYANLLPNGSSWNDQQNRVRENGSATEHAKLRLWLDFPLAMGTDGLSRGGQSGIIFLQSMPAVNSNIKQEVA